MVATVVGIDAESASAALTTMSDDGLLTEATKKAALPTNALGGATLVEFPLRDDGDDDVVPVNSPEAPKQEAANNATAGVCTTDESCPAASPLCVQLGGGEGAKCVCASAEVGKGATKCGKPHKWWTYQDRENSYVCIHVCIHVCIQVMMLPRALYCVPMVSLLYENV